MTDNSKRTEQDGWATEFERQASQAQRGFFGEAIDFLMHNKKWWLTPIFLVLLLFGLLVILGGGPVAPFIYTLF